MEKKKVDVVLDQMLDEMANCYPGSEEAERQAKAIECIYKGKAEAEKARNELIVTAINAGKDVATYMAGIAGTLTLAVGIMKFEENGAITTKAFSLLTKFIKK